MAGDKDFQRRLELIERGIRELEATADAGLRATVQQLVQSIVDLHGRSLARALEIVESAGIAGPAIMDRLARDPLVSPLLLLHSLHPLGIEARVLRSLESVQASLHAKHASAALLGVTEGVIRIRVVGGPEQRALVERAVIDAAPDLAALDIEGADEAVVGFVPLESLRRADAPPTPPQLHSPLAVTGGA